MEFKDRVRAARKHAKLNQAQLAAKAGIHQSVVSKIEQGLYLQSRFSVAIATSCGVNPTWLVSGSGEMLGDSTESPYMDQSIAQGSKMAFEVSWKQVAKHAKDGSPLTPEGATEQHPMPTGAGARTFVLSVPGESMLPEYTSSHLIFVDPDRRVKSGDDVVAYVAGKGEAMLRRYIEEPGSGKMLKALNPAFGAQYEQLKEEDMVIGVVIADMRLR